MSRIQTVAAALTLAAAFAVNAQTGARYIVQLQAQAHALHLAERPEWRALVHYRHNLIRSGYTSQADDPGFFNAKDGKTDPAAELDATLAAFFSDAPETDKTQNPQCRFIARYHWLDRQLHFDPARLPPQPCRRYQAWHDALAPRSVTLVFPAAYLNNPSSMFGHTLLRVDGAGQTADSRLLAYAINYAANADPRDGGATFAVKGIFGDYPGLFSIAPYYNKVKEYSDIENRDIWEYQLTLTRPEIDRLLMHAWELGPTNFDYYFFDENCAYHLLSLLDVARPGLDLIDRFPAWVIPSDTVVAVVNTPGLVRRVVYRPSMSTELRYRLSRLTAAEHVLVHALASGALAPDDARIEALPAERRARVLDAAHEVVRYQYARGCARDESARVSYRLLVARSKLDVPPESDEPPPPDTRPELGHKSGRVSFGAGRRAHRDYVELRWRPAYHDLLDPDAGYTPGAQINFLDVTLRSYAHERGVVLQSLDLIDIVSLFPREDFFRGPSWKVSTGLFRKPTARHEFALMYVLNVGSGGAWQRGPATFYAFIEAQAELHHDLRDDYALGVGPSVGVLLAGGQRWKANLFARALDFGLGGRHREKEVGLEQRVSIGGQTALRLNVQRRQSFGRRWNSVNLSFQRYL